VLRTFTIITTEAIAMMAELHGRIPVILASEDWPTWLGKIEGDPVTLPRAGVDDVRKVWSVSKQVNSPKNNGADLLEAVG
jgi:putative SOS response-associated peptidase YedK